MLSRNCAFTGHRPCKFPWKYDETDSRCVALKTALAEQIMILADAGVTQFLSGMAEAVDSWSALTVLALREKNPAIKLHYDHTFLRKAPTRDETELALSL